MSNGNAYPQCPYCGRHHDHGSPRFVTYRDLKGVYGVPYSRAHIDRLRRKPDNDNDKFPHPARLSDHRVAFYASCILAWMATRNMIPPPPLDPEDEGLED